MEPPNVIDISVKALFRHRPEAVLRLAGLHIDQQALRVEDPNVNLPELRADHVFLLEPDGGAIYLEYQLHPDQSVLADWFTKCGGLTKQLGKPVVLLAIYLQKGDRTTFPDSYTATVGGLNVEFRFPVIRLWEHAERIESGELPELAPLLVLCEEKPTEATVRREVALIRGSGLPTEIQGDLLAVAIQIATRRFSRRVLNRLFEEVKPMIKGGSFIDDWIAEGQVVARNEEARRMALRVLSKRFGELPSAMVERIQAADAEGCERLVDRALEVEALTELDLLEGE